MPDNVNVGFKRGSQSSLNTLKNGSGNRFSEGTFYLTNDTDRLYYAQSATELVELNKSIHIVDDLDDLPLTTATTTTAIKGSEVEVGQFYYVKAGANSVSGNILAVCSAISNGNITWTQVNPDTDTDTDTKYTFSTVTTATADITNGASATTKFKIQPKTINGTNIGSAQTISSTINFTGDTQIGVSQSSGTIKLAGNIGVGATSSTSNNNATISTTGTGAGSGSVTINGNDYIHFSGGGSNPITIAGGGVSGVSVSGGTITVPVTAVASFTPILSGKACSTNTPWIMPWPIATTSRPPTQSSANSTKNSRSPTQ